MLGVENAALGVAKVWLRLVQVEGRRLLVNALASGLICLQSLSLLLPLGQLLQMRFSIEVLVTGVVSIIWLIESLVPLGSLSQLSLRLAKGNHSHVFLG